MKDLILVFAGIAIFLLAAPFRMDFLAGGLCMYIMLRSDDFDWNRFVNGFVHTP